LFAITHLENIFVGIGKENYGLLSKMTHMGHN
jgi:hypothetical protein